MKNQQRREQLASAGAYAALRLGHQALALIERANGNRRTAPRPTPGRAPTTTAARRTTAFYPPPNLFSKVMS
jgi:hypothetical protein